MKKILFFLLVCCALFTFSSCSLANITRQKEERNRELLALGGMDGFLFGMDYRCEKDGEVVYYASLIESRVRADGQVDLGKDNLTENNIKGVAYDGHYYAFSIAYHREDSKTDSVLVGYLDLLTSEVVYYETDCPYSLSLHVGVYPCGSNEDYFFFQTVGDGANTYILIDRKSNEFSEHIEDLSLYERENEPVNPWDAIEADVNYDYVLARSETMKEIDRIVGAYRRQTAVYHVYYEDRMFVSFASEMTMFGKGELLPVVFEYCPKTDSFVYLGCVENRLDNHVLAVIPTASS